jgi:CO dehydrogenase/acetyl-CoA synthase epsilon subunit
VQFDHTSPGYGGNVDTVQEQKRLREIKKAKHNSMVAGTAKLQEMVAELNDEISSTKSVALTADQRHKLAKIEKLARNIHETMGILAR